MPDQSWVSKTTRFAELPEGFSLHSESGDIRVILSSDQSIVGIQFPRFPSNGPGHDEALFREGFDYPDNWLRDIWIRSATDFLGARRGEHGQDRNPREAEERRAICGDGKEANIADAVALVRKLQEKGRGRG